MLRIFRRDKSLVSEPSAPSSAVHTGVLAKLKAGLQRTRQQFAHHVADLFLGKKVIDVSLWEDLETLLLQADVGVSTTRYLLDSLTEHVSRQHIAEPSALLEALKTALIDILDQPSLASRPHVDGRPCVYLFIGINGAGKTTTIGKLAHRFLNAGQTLMLAAGDTFRAAAIEQLQIWGERNHVSVVAQHAGADSAAVIFDAYVSARARGVDLLLADTAGRLHTQQPLMAELQKVKRMLAKQDVGLPDEVILIIDASIGQNALTQAREFARTMGVTGIVLTKLDGTAKGGVIFAIVAELGIPIYYIGVGEGIDDLQVFDAETFVDALFAV
jgi:fused signal recognition particle receptor